MDSNYSANAFTVGTDARLSLGSTQSNRNKLIEVEVFVPFTNDKPSAELYYQVVEFAIFFNYDNGGSWTLKLTDKREVAAGIGSYDAWMVNPIRYLTYRLYDSGVTDVRLDLFRSAANGVLLTGDENDGNRITSMDLIRVGYYYEDTSESTVNDRVLGY